ncbi:MAG: Fe-S cluster assembly sulfur transfer protein SufU [Myxococcota bacterium]
MSNLLRTLYNTTLLDHSRAPRNFAPLKTANIIRSVNNPTCGDRLEIQLIVSRGVISNAAFQGAACSVAIASASMMTEALKGRSFAEARDLRMWVAGVFSGEDRGGLRAWLQETPTLRGLRKLTAVREFPTRRVCAQLPWTALDAALSETGNPVLETRPAPDAPSAVEQRALQGWLVACNGPMRGEDFKLWLGATRLGNAVDNDIRVRDPYVSPHHCTITCFDAEERTMAGFNTVAELVATNNRNGTFLNQKRVSPNQEEELIDCDTVRLGKTEFKVKLLY